MAKGLFGTHEEASQQKVRTVFVSNFYISHLNINNRAALDLLFEFITLAKFCNGRLLTGALPHQNFANTHLYLRVEKSIVKVKCLAQEHNTMTLGLNLGRSIRRSLDYTCLFIFFFQKLCESCKEN